MELPKLLIQKENFACSIYFKLVCACVRQMLSVVLQKALFLIARGSSITPRRCSSDLPTLLRVQSLLLLLTLNCLPVAVCCLR